MSEESESPLKFDTLSITCLNLKLYFGEIHLSTATGFVVQYKDQNFLVTNWHVLSGRNAETEQPLSSKASIPDQVRIAHNVKGKTGHWTFYGERLLNDDGSRRWIEHPRGPSIDVACLPLHDVADEVQLYPLNLKSADVDLVLYPGMPVSVIGFLLGLRPNAFFGIWKAGHIASDPDLARGEDASILIDATTREGMSGAPVFARTFGHRMTSRGLEIGVGLTTRFLGIYSGRIHKDSEIGRVWHPRVIVELLERATA
jgi:hypothetical protein